MKELYSIKELNKLQPDKGKLLLSEPFLFDPFFRRVVILLTEHHKKGSVGFVLNKPTDMKINKIMTDFPPYNTEVYLGGPVAKNTLHYIHTLGQQLDGSIEIAEGLYWGGNFETLKLLIDTKQIQPNEIKFFVGYAGWTSDQLEKEIQENSWFVVDTHIEQIMLTDTTDLWKNILKKMGSTYSMIANFPENPMLN